MAITIVSSTTKDGGAAGVTSDAIDTSGANLLIAAVSAYTLSGGTMSHSKIGNTWIPLTSVETGGESKVQIFYCTSVAQVGSGHTFSFTNSNAYASISVYALAGAHATAPYEAENGSSGISSDPGALTPAADNEFLITAYAHDVGGATDRTFASGGTGWTILTPQVMYGGGSHEGLAVASKIQTTAGAEHPVWEIGAAGAADATIACFKVAAGGWGRLVSNELNRLVRIVG